MFTSDDVRRDDSGCVYKTEGAGHVYLIQAHNCSRFKIGWSEIIHKNDRPEETIAINLYLQEAK